MKVLKYYKIAIKGDNDCYSIVAKTKKEVIRLYKEELKVSGEDFMKRRYADHIEQVEYYTQGNGLLDVLFDVVYTEGGCCEEVVKTYPIK